ARHLHAEAAVQPHDVAEITSHFCRVDVDPTGDFEPRTSGDLFHDGSTNGSESEMHHADSVHKRELYSSTMFGKKAAAGQKPDVHPGGLTREHVVWAYRLLLDRDPESEDVIAPKLAGSRDTCELRHHLMTSAEFRDKNPDYAQTNDRTIVIKELETPDGPVRLFVDLADHVIGLNIVRGRYEAAEVEFVRRLMRPGDVAIDAGAHIGFFTVQLAARVGAAGP